MSWDLPNFASKDVVFIGRGREGKSFEQFINQHGQIKSFRFVDQVDDPDYLEKLKNLEMNTTVVVKTAGCPGRLVPVPYTTPTNVFFELVKTTGATIVGITGTKGKSTTSSLVHHILKADGKRSILCGNIGHPMIDYLDEATPETIFVLELGAYQTADLTASPNIGMIVNLFHEHLDYFGSVEAYFEAKHRLITQMSPDDIYVYNPEFPLLSEWAEAATSRKLAIDLSKLDEIDISKAKLMGEHNRKNILAAQTVARLLGTNEETVRHAPYSFEPLRHRLQLIANINDVMYYDDAISTTPESAIAAIETVGNIGTMLLGGHDRGYDFTELGKLLAEYKIPALVLFPPSGTRIKQALPAGYSPVILETTGMQEAVNFAAEHAPKGTSVLLSTASPSYGLWKDFEEKGDAFQAAVKGLTKNLARSHNL